MPYTVLAVDDNEATRYAMTRLLEKEGFATIQAGTGTDALRIARHGHPDVVLLDINLPDISGFEVCRTLKNDPVTDRIPVVIHSASQSSGAAAQSYELGACAFLIGPVEPDHLLHVVRGCLARGADTPSRPE